ncbi:MAG TPA: PHB depolymerase family esterase [Allosphingosinicella sp.]|nr:PHB depolymerase family esterase [Allosphingosinicella sp.]
MRLPETIASLKRAKRRMPDFQTKTVQPQSDRLSDLTGLAANPGNLRARYYVPEGLERGAPLVVVLHGCTQSAAAYDLGSGWSTLADRHGFSLLFPEQQRGNNQNLCFNWFEPKDTGRGRGEAASIAAMVERMPALHGSDRGRIFITGLSAGGAMSSVMMARYPELFAGGAVVAGLPFGCASNVSEAFGCMGGRGEMSSAVLGEQLRAASAHKGAWPRISVWHGSADHTVAPANGDAVVSQWLQVHGLPANPSRTEMIEGHTRSVWLGADGRELIEQYIIKGMGHGTPIKPGSGEGALGEAGPHMLNAGISSTSRIAQFWGITPKGAAAKAAQAKPAGQAAEAKPAPKAAEAAEASSGVQRVIEDALKSAGLLR